MRILVCGGRDYTNKDNVFRYLDMLALHRFLLKGPITCIIEGEAPGVDTFARQWAEQYPIPVEPYPADWRKYGKAAGPIRNKKMLAEGKPDIVVAFKGGDGTANMVKQALKAGVPVITVKEPDDG